MTQVYASFRFKILSRLQAPDARVTCQSCSATKYVATHARLVLVASKQAPYAFLIV